MKSAKSAAGIAKVALVLPRAVYLVKASPVKLLEVAPSAAVADYIDQAYVAAIDLLEEIATTLIV